MRRLKTRRLIATLTAVLAVVASGVIDTVANPFSASAETVCSTAWASSKVYVGGDKAGHKGVEYRAKWWTTNEEPGTTGQWGVWESLGACGGGTDPTDPPTTEEPTRTRPATPARAVTSTPRTSSSGASTGATTMSRHRHLRLRGEPDPYHLRVRQGQGTASCTMDDSYAAIESLHRRPVGRRRRRHRDQPLRGNFDQLRKLKDMHPDLKIVWSFGGWTTPAASARPRRTRPPSPSPATTCCTTRAGRACSTASTSTGSTPTPAA